MLLLLLATLPTTIEVFIWVIGTVFYRRVKPGPSKQHNLVILVPAYNEEKVILKCLNSLKALGKPIFVVADHCTDKTVELSIQQGASVIERKDGIPGKPYALEFAFDILKEMKFTHFLIIDADSTVSSNMAAVVEAFFSQGYDFIQTHYSTARDDFLSRIYYLKLESINHVRPLAKQALGLRPGCFGNGFAISDRGLKNITLKGLVEDQGLFFDLALQNKKVVFTDQANVLAFAPPNIEAHVSQTKRWEGGRIDLLKEYFIPLLKGGHFEVALSLLMLPVLYYVLALAILYFFYPAYSLIALIFLFIHYIQTFIIAKGDVKDLLSLVMIPQLIWIKVLSFSRLWTRSSWTRTPR